MRQVLSISLPGDVIKEIKNRVKNRGFRSISGYVKYLFELDNDDGIISEKELMDDIKQARRDYKDRKLKTLKSLKDLM